ncbi:Nucleolar protein 4 [Yarrowia sp. B02]|nr:Nucleolar protein 4 [Yarrowia sp. B02]
MVRDANDKVDKGKTDLFVRSIPLEVTNEELADFFSQDFPVKHAVVVTNAATKESKGFGFVSFTTEEDAAEALMKCRKQKLKGKILQIEFAKPRERKTREDRPFESSEAVSVEKRKPRLIVRNLPWSVRSPQDLIKVFSKYGKVVDAFIPRGAGGKMSGFGFVTMSKKQHADKAVAESKGLEIDGRTVTVDFAIEKDKWLKHKDGEEVEEEEYDDDEDVKEEDDIKVEEEVKEEVKEEDLDLDESNADVAEGDDDEDEIEEDDEEEEEEEEEDDTPKVKAQSNASTVFVRNIPYDATAESLKEHFELFGPVRYALPVIDKGTGQPRGTAFVAFESSDDCDKCVERAPASATTSLLVADDTDPRYVFEGRILAVTQAVQRETANKLSEHNSKKRAEALGKLPKEKDRRNVFLINEGRIGENSALGMTLPKADMELRQKSYDQRKKQLNGNPSLHVSLTRLALRNLPRALNAKGLKALGRKAVVQFATEVKEGARQPLSKEEAIRSTKARGEEAKSKHGVVRQAKVIMEQKESGELGRSRGYGFLEFRDHKAALMALRWLNAHEVSTEEVLDGYEEKERRHVDLAGSSRRHLVAEFAIENAQVVKRRKETMARINMQKKRHRDEDGAEGNDNKRPRREGGDRKDRKGGDRKGGDRKGKGDKKEERQPEKDKNLELGKLIGQKRMRKKKGGK